jgi:PAS domain S-box-containing protein
MKYKLQDLIDINQFQKLQDSLNKIYSFPSSIIDNDGNILTATAWQDVCTHFHRKNRASEQACIKSDRYILNHIHKANPAVTYRCPHGLVDNAMPIIIGGVHYGNFFTGQFFLESPDLTVFKTQAQKYGFNEDAYLDAVKRVPIWTQEQLNNYLRFIKGLIAVICESGLKTLKEIENRKRIETSEKRHRSILKSAMDGYWLTDTKGRLLEVNDAYCRMSGYTEQELLTLRIPDLESVEDPQLVAEHMEKVISQGFDRFETLHRCKDGNFLNVEVSIQFRPEEGGQCVCFLRDITGRVQADKKMYDMAERLKLATRAGRMGIWDWDILKNELIWDDGMYQLYGLHKKDFPNIYKAWLNCIHPDDRERNDRISLEARLGQREYETEFRIIRPDGGIRFVKAMGQVIRDKNGSPTRMIGINYDITQKREMKTHIQQAQKMEAIGHLAGGIAHDFNNILYPIIGLSELLIEDLVSGSPEHENALGILTAGKRGSELVKQILAFSRQAEDKQIPVQVQKIAIEALKLCRSTIPVEIELIQKIQEDCPLVLANPTQLHQVVMNLITNAVHAVEQEAGNISIELKEMISTPGDEKSDFTEPGRYAKLSVTDNGIGIPPAVISKIFEPYFTTKKDGKGTGLGLAMVQGIVKEHKGEIRVNSQVNRGTTVTIYLPLMQKAGKKTTSNTCDIIERGHEHILVIDDESTIAGLEMQMLERLGYTVTMGGTSLDALKIFRANPDSFDLVLTDMAMPHLSGVELARELLLITPDIPLVLCTGFSEKIDEHKARAIGFKGFLMKPMGMRDLAKTIRTALDEKLVNETA